MDSDKLPLYQLRRSRRIAGSDPSKSDQLESSSVSASGHSYPNPACDLSAQYETPTSSSFDTRTDKDESTSASLDGKSESARERKILFASTAANDCLKTAVIDVVPRAMFNFTSSGDSTDVASPIGTPSMSNPSSSTVVWSQPSSLSAEQQNDSSESSDCLKSDEKQSHSSAAFDASTPRKSRELFGDFSSSVESETSDDASTGEGTSNSSLNATQRRSIRKCVVGHHRRPAHERYTEQLGAFPVQGESFCKCSKQTQSKDLRCPCGEDDDVYEWTWDNEIKSSAAEITDDGRDVRFHINYSSGTAAVRGSEPMTDRQYFWELKMITPVYGTDMMVGVGTSNVDPDAFRYNFCSLLGHDGESWGLSYYGKAQHKGQFSMIKGGRFGQGSILGIHLDMWHGTLSFYKNRKPLGVIFSGLRGKTLYPMVSSTAARTGIKLIKACSYATSLEFLCCQVLRAMVPPHLDVTVALRFPPGLHDFFLVNNLFWLLRSNELVIPLSAKKRPITCVDDKEDDDLPESGLKRPRLEQE